MQVKASCFLQVYQQWNEIWQAMMRLWRADMEAIYLALLKAHNAARIGRLKAEVAKRLVYEAGHGRFRA